MTPTTTVTVIVAVSTTAWWLLAAAWTSYIIYGVLTGPVARARCREQHGTDAHESVDLGHGFKRMMGRLSDVGLGLTGAVFVGLLTVGRSLVEVLYWTLATFVGTALIVALLLWGVGGSTLWRRRRQARR